MWQIVTSADQYPEIAAGDSTRQIAFSLILQHTQRTPRVTHQYRNFRKPAIKHLPVEFPESLSREFYCCLHTHITGKCCLYSIKKPGRLCGFRALCQSMQIICQVYSAGPLRHLRSVRHDRAPHHRGCCISTHRDSTDGSPAACRCGPGT